MAERRMFAKSIIESDAFLDLPISTRLLYFDLGMRGDDDGFVDSPKRIMRTIGASEDDLKLLIAKQFLIPLENGVVVVRHWNIHNSIRADRYKPTQYQLEKSTLSKEKGGAYTALLPSGIPDDNQMPTNCQPVGCIGKDRLGKVSKEDILLISDETSAPPPTKKQRKIQEDSAFNSFWETYPRKVGKESALKAWKKLGVDSALLGVIVSAVEKTKATAQWQDEGGKFIPHPASWLNGKRWEDEIQTENGQAERKWGYLD